MLKKCILEKSDKKKNKRSKNELRGVVNVNPKNFSKNSIPKDDH